MECSGSVALCETVPDRQGAAAKEGEQGHEVLEEMLGILTDPRGGDIFAVQAPNDIMWDHASKAASFIRNLWQKTPHSEVLIETRIYLDFIHPEMFGTFDSSVIEHFGTLNVFDYKYGTWPVSPKKNLQMIFYGIGLAHLYGWNFKHVRLWIIQPRTKNYDGPVYWDVPILELKNKWVPLYEAGVERVEKYPKRYKEGSWCFFCNAKGICPLKKESKDQKAALVFGGKLV